MLPPSLTIKRGLSMRTSVEYQRSASHHKSSTQVKIETRENVPSITLPCYEHQQVVELAEVTIGASQTTPLCERHF